MNVLAALRAAMPTDEAYARQQIDKALEEAGWQVQDRDQANLFACQGVAVREFSLKPGYGEADYLLFAGAKAVGIVEAKKQGQTLTGVEVQSTKYSAGLPETVPAYTRPLPFLYESTGIETQFTNRLDPEPRSRGLFAFHQPKTLIEWANPSPVAPAKIRGVGEEGEVYDGRTTLRG